MTSRVWRWLPALAVTVALGVAGCDGRTTTGSSEVTSAAAGEAGDRRPHGGAERGGVAEASAKTADAAPALCEHGVPKDVCTRCNADLIPVFKDMGDWCDEHGLPESHCRECHPDLVFTAPAAPEDWCGEHGVPESMCTKCSPALVARFIEAGDYCREHGYPKSVCPRCNPELVTARGKPLPAVTGPGTKVRLASASTASEIGIETAPVRHGRLAERLDVVGRLEFDQNRLAQLSTAVEAAVMEVEVDVGDEVRAGDPLVILASAAVGDSQAKLAAAEARVETAASTLAREQSLLSKGVSARKDMEKARSELAAARAELAAARASLRVAGASSKASEGRYVLSSPMDGTVVARDVVAGRTVAPGQTLIQVADLSTMWALLELPEGKASKVRPGQRVSLRIEGLDGPELVAVVSRVGASVDPATRTVRGRVDLPNDDRSLKAGAFVSARIDVTAARDAALVPKEAVQFAEGQPVVFVPESESVYLPKPVKLGAESEGRVEVLEGLDGDGMVVTTGAFLLKTEILKDSIGAGCCEGGEE